MSHRCIHHSTRLSTKKLQDYTRSEEKNNRAAKAKNKANASRHTTRPTARINNTQLELKNEPRLENESCLPEYDPRVHSSLDLSSAHQAIHHRAVGREKRVERRESR